MNQNTILRLIFEEEIRKLDFDSQAKVNELCSSILEIANSNAELGAMAMALASAKFAESNG